MVQKIIEQSLLLNFKVVIVLKLIQTANAEENNGFFIKLWRGIKDIWNSEPVFVSFITITYIVVVLLLFFLILFKIFNKSFTKKDSETQITIKHTKSDASKPNPDEKPFCAVLLNDVYYKIGRKSILKAINMRITRGEIYGLLGPSGCGKTTLLRLIIGLKKPNSGNVIVFGSKPGTRESGIPGCGVGYMPQEAALYREFTLKETLEYYGQIYGLSKEKRNERRLTLLKVLDLPNDNQLLESLSGGQRRRASLAVALINNPPLLILDEPTVGVDPLLRQTIWNYLRELTKNEKVTVIITTHYIEEARQANKIALMRKGRLLIESEPDALLSQHNVNTLEAAFLKICETEPKSKELKSKIDEFSHEKKTQELLEKEQFAPYPCESSKSNTIREHFNIIAAISRKSFIRIRRNNIELIFQLVLPALQLIIFLICVGSEPHNLNVAVYDPDKNYSQQFLAELDSEIFILKELNSFNDALKEVENGNAWLAIVFDANYTHYVRQRFNFLDENLTNETLDKSKIKVYVDMTEFPIQVTIMQSIRRTASKYSSMLIEQIPFEINKAALTANFYEVIDPPVYGTLKPNFRDFVAPGIIISITFILSVALSALPFVLERRSGLLERSLIAGVQTYHIVISHFLVQITVILFRTGILFFAAFVIFDIHLKGDLILSLILASLQGMSGMSFGFVISSLCKEEQMAILLSLSTFYPSLLLSGVIWPIEGMPLYMKYFSYLLPLTLPTKALRAMITRGWGLSYIDIWLGFIATLAWIFIFNTIAIIVLKFNN